MRRVISSSYTIVFKLLVPLMLVSLSILLVFSLFAYTPNLPSNALIGTLLLVVATTFFCWWGARLKRVSVDDENLYASNWIKEISIPISEIVAVDALPGGGLVTIRLKARSEFGRNILFLAKWQPLLFSSHPILDELRQLINQKQNR
jgi:hypothetical protein